MNPCRLCGKLDVELFSLKLKFGEQSFTIYICKDCTDLIDYTDFLLHYCMHCGNVFLTPETDCRDTIMLVSNCGICERGSQKLKQGGNHDYRRNEKVP
jgi:DNA-directed RNA polymerase subunit M/transcription elongation factor TFIIS